MAIGKGKKASSHILVFLFLLVLLNCICNVLKIMEEADSSLTLHSQLKQLTLTNIASKKGRHTLRIFLEKDRKDE